MADKQLWQVIPVATDVKNDDGVIIGGQTAGTRFAPLTLIASYVHNMWAAFINAITPLKTSFASGDKIPVVNGNTATAMEADKLLEITAQNALAGNVAKEFDIAVDYLPGEKCLYDNKLVQFVTKHSAGAIVAGETKRVDLINPSDGMSEKGYYIPVGSLNVGDAISYVPAYSSSYPDTTQYGVFNAEGIKFIKFTDAFGGDSPRLWCFVDDEDKVIAHESQPASPDVRFTKIVIVPENAKYIIVSIRTGSFEFVREDGITLSGGYIDTDLNGKANYESTANVSYNCYIKKVKAHDSFIATMSTGGGLHAKAWAFADENLNIIESKVATSITDKLLVAPTNSRYFIVSSYVAIEGNVRSVIHSDDGNFTRLSTPILSHNAWDISGATINPNTTYTASAEFLLAAISTEGYTHAVVFGRCGVDARLFAFIDASNNVLSVASSRQRSGFAVVEIPVAAKCMLFQSIDWGYCYLIKSKDSLRDVRSDVQKIQDGLVSVFKSNVDSSGYLQDGILPINLVNPSECCVMTLDCEFASGTPSITYSVDDALDVKYKLSRTGQRCKYRFRVPPASVTGYAQLSFAVAGTSFKLYGISFTYGGLQKSEICGVRYDSHLGAIALAPEHTMAAYSLAAQLGYQGCICNPIKSADGTFYCYHEDTASLTLDGTTAVSLSAAQFHAKTDAELAEYKVFGTGTWQQKVFSERIPTLEEFLKLCADTGMRPVFSTHPSLSSSECEEVKMMCDKLGLTDKLTIKAFDLSMLETAYAVFGKIDRYVIDYMNVDDIDAEIEAIQACSFCVPEQKVGVEIRSYVLTQEMADAVLAAGFALGSWSFRWGTTDPNTLFANFTAALDKGVTFVTEDGEYPNVGMLWR